MRRAYSYIRFSKKDQANGDSLRRQLEGTQAYCGRKGLLLDDSLRLHDLGVSAYRGKNADVGALATFLEAVRTGRVPRGSILVIESLDRLSRNEIDEAFELFRGLLKADIDIVTLTPEREYTRASVKDFAGLLEPLFIMSRAHEESATKSARIKEALRRKRERMPQERFSSACPKWLRPNPDGNGFLPIPEAVATVRRIYELAREGYGAIQTTERLNQEGFAPFGGKKDRWCRMYVTTILSTRAVLGEYQPHVMREGKRVPEGKPIPNYFPAIISEADWYATRRAVGLRRKQRGPWAKRVRSLFTGIIFDARDGRSMIVRTKGHGRREEYLISSGTVNREHSGEVPSVFFPYQLIEKWFLSFLSNDLIVELLRQRPEGQDEEIASLTGKLMDLDRRIQAVQRAIEEEPDYETQIAMLPRLEKQKKSASARLEKLRLEQTHSDAETLGESRSIFALMQKCSPDELLDLRTRLKARIRSLVESIWVLPQGDRRRKLATVQVFLRNGRWTRFTPEHPDPGTSIWADGGSVSTLTPQDDLRQWRHLAEKPTFGSTHSGGMKFTRYALERIQEVVRKVLEQS